MGCLRFVLGFILFMSVNANAQIVGEQTITLEASVVLSCSEICLERGYEDELGQKNNITKVLKCFKRCLNETGVKEHLDKKLSIIGAKSDVCVKPNDKEVKK